MAALVTSMQNAIRWLISLDPLTKIEILETSFSELFSLCCQSGVFIQWYCSNSLGGEVVLRSVTVILIPFCRTHRSRYHVKCRTKN